MTFQGEIFETVMDTPESEILFRLARFHLETYFVFLHLKMVIFCETNGWNCIQQSKSLNAHPNSIDYYRQHRFSNDNSIVNIVFYFVDIESVQNRITNNTLWNSVGNSHSYYGTQISTKQLYNVYVNLKTACEIRFLRNLFLFM